MNGGIEGEAGCLTVVVKGKRERGCEGKVEGGKRERL